MIASKRLQAAFRSLALPAPCAAVVAAIADTSALAQQPPVEAGDATSPLAAGLSAGGWAFMLLSLAFVWVLTLWCFRLVLSAPTATDPGPAAKP